MTTLLQNGQQIVKDDVWRQAERHERLTDQQFALVCNRDNAVECLQKAELDVSRAGITWRRLETGQHNVYELVTARWLG